MRSSTLRPDAPLPPPSEESDPPVAGSFAPNDNMDAATEIDSKIQLANSAIVEKAAALTKRKFPYYEWESFCQRWNAFYTDLVDSWWSRVIAHDRLLAYRREWESWRKVLASYGIKQAVHRPYDPSDDAPGSSSGGGFGFGAGVALAGGLLVGGYFVARKYL